MLEIFAHPDLSHQLVLVAVHACQLTHMSKDVLQSISQLQHRGEILGLVKYENTVKATAWIKLGCALHYLLLN